MSGHRTGDSIGSALDQQKGISAGFDVLRWLLALAIFYGHCKWLAGSPASVAASLPGEAAGAVGALAERGWSGFKRPLQVSLVPMFFALSGFLVTASALRVREVAGFLTLRGLRIFPALTVEVTLSALVLGPLLTTLALADYFTDWSFWRYFGNILGFVSYELPGVFAGNRVTNIVNVNLWTLPAEFYCYLIMALLMASGQAFDRRRFTQIFAAITVAAIAASFATGFGISQTTASTPVIVYYFFAGCLAFHWRNEIPRDWRLLLVAGLAAYGLQMAPETAFLAPAAVVYVTVYLGVLHHARLKGLRKFDYSYGIYLYGFPITQAWLALMPSLQGHGVRLAVVALATTLVFAALSWHWIEAPMLALKQRLTKTKSASRPAPASAGAQPSA